MEFWLSQNFSYELSSFFHDGILAITKPFTQTFFFHMMEFWLSRSLFTSFSFTRWNSGYHEAFHTNIFLSHDGISAITEPFHEFFFHTMKFQPSRSLSHEFFYFTRWNLDHHGAFSRIFLSHDGNSAITEPFHEFFFHVMEFTKCTIWGKTLFIYITKSIYIGSASLKTLPLDLEPPLQGKEYGPPYCNEIAEKKVNVFVPEITYRFVIRILLF
jgi:hypothetical protein